MVSFSQSTRAGEKELLDSARMENDSFIGGTGS